QLVYGCRDDDSGGTDQSSLYSAARGHDFGRNMYGWNWRYAPSSLNFDPTANQNTVAFNGLGALRTHTVLIGGLSYSDYDLHNYTYNTLDGILRDPERLGSRTNPNSPPGLYVGGANVSYTYPDRNNMFLAAVMANDQTIGNQPKVLRTSFVRPNPRF